MNRLEGELMYEVDALYVSTEMILSRDFRKYPLDSLMLDVCLLHFRVVWDFFYGPKKMDRDVVASDYAKAWAAPGAPARLIEIRKWLNSMLAHLTKDRVNPAFKAGEITEADIGLIRSHTEVLMMEFAKLIPPESRSVFVNPLAHKFAGYKTLSLRGEGAEDKEPGLANSATSG